MRNVTLPLVLALALVAAAAVTAVAFVAFLDAGDSPRGPVGVTLDDITEERGRYLGRTVTVKSRIEEIVSRRAFTVEAEPGNVVLVVGERPLKAISAPRVDDGDLVRVTGRVATADPEEYDLEVKEARDVPAILDATITRTGSRGPRSTRPQLSARELEQSPREHLGRLVTVEATVGRVINSRAWEVGDDLLAVSDLKGARRIEEGGRVRMTGVLRRFSPRRLKRDSGIKVSRRVRRRDDRYVLVVRGIDFVPGSAAR